MPVLSCLTWRHTKTSAVKGLFGSVGLTMWEVRGRWLQCSQEVLWSEHMFAEYLDIKSLLLFPCSPKPLNWVTVPPVPCHALGSARGGATGGVGAPLFWSCCSLLQSCPALLRGCCCLLLSLPKTGRCSYLNVHASSPNGQKSWFKEKQFPSVFIVQSGMKKREIARR